MVNQKCVSRALVNGPMDAAHHVSHVLSLVGWLTDLEAHHDHACDPEEEDVQPRLQQRCGVEGLDSSNWVD